MLDDEWAATVRSLLAAMAPSLGIQISCFRLQAFRDPFPHFFAIDSCCFIDIVPLEVFTLHNCSYQDNGYRLEDPLDTGDNR